MSCEVLGATGSQPGRGRACSGYLLTSGDTTVLVDCGFGIATRLTSLMDPADLDAIFITHRHLDHAIDLLGIWAVLRRADAQVPVHVADEVRETVEALVTPHRLETFRKRLPMTTLAAGDVVEVGDLQVATHRSNHGVPTLSLRVTEPGGGVLAYSSDSAGGGDLLACARDADVFVCEASWQEGEAREGDGHMTARRAGEVATEAGVGQLVLTHLRPHLDPSVSIEQATQSWSGPIVVAHEGMRLEVDGSTSAVS